MASPKMSLKLLVDKKGQRVLFAEATKEFVDFLFHIFSLPLGTLIELSGSKQMVGCLGKLKVSIDILNGSKPNTTCPSCKSSMNNTVNIPKSEKAVEAEKNVVRYMVMDDLVVKPMSPISSITLINSFGVTDLSQLEEKVVSFGQDEALKLLMASLKTDKVLSALFLDNHFKTVFRRPFRLIIKIVFVMLCMGFVGHLLEEMEIISTHNR